jgi:hypothetical protein
MDGIRLPQPEGWDDKSMIAFNARERSPSGVVANLVITEDEFGDVQGSTPVERIKSYANRQVSEMKDKLPEPVIHSQTLTQVAGRPAAEVSLSWQHGATRLTQLVTFVSRNASKVMICTGTAAADEFEQHKQVFRQTLQTVQISA